MFAQFFGGYLLNSGKVTAKQLADAIDEKKNTRMRLGVLAINEGLMTSEQVEHVNATQQTVDKLFGDLAVELGYLRPSDVDELLHKQPTDYLLLGQTLVNHGALSNAEFEEAINAYKSRLFISDDDISGDQNEKLTALINEFYHFNTAENAKLYTGYVTLLFKNLIRFIGEDFTPLEATILNDGFYADLAVRQNIGGAYTASTIIAAGADEYPAFARRFAKDAYIRSEEFDNSAVGEFLNVCNGLFAVNESNESGSEISLTSPEYLKNEKIELKAGAVCIPIQFSFGEIEFIVSF